MSHMIYFRGEQASMAYVGKTPWHGLGQNMPENASIEAWIKAAGFDFTIEDAPVDFDVDGVCHTVPGRHVLYRSDTQAPMSIVSGRYKVVQPAEVMDFFKDVCHETGFTLETAGVLKQGGMYWGLAKTGLNGTVNGDTHDAYVLLATSCDLTLATTAKMTAVRVVCWNTLSWAMESSKGESVKVKHSTTFDPASVKKTLGLVDYDRSWEQFRETMGALGDKHVSDNQAKEFFTELLRPKSQKPRGRNNLQAGQFNQLLNAPVGGGYTPVQTDKERAIRGFESLVDCYHNAPGAVPGTAYGLLQGVTRYVDHERGKDADKRLTSAWFGQGETLKQRAVEMAQAM